MWNSKDLALVILITVASLIFTASVGQLAWLFSGVPGSNMAFTIGNSIIISLGLLLFKGRRWRFLLMQALFALLVIPTFLLGTPFDVLPRLIILLHGIQGDIILNSFYGYFEKKGKLLWWSIFCSVEFFIVSPFLSILWFSIIFPPAFVTTFTNTILILLPLSITESVAGGFIAHKIYQRIEKVGWYKEY